VEDTAPTDSDSAAWVVVVVCALSALALWRFWTAGPPTGDDWGHYLSHARALLEGRPYADTGYLFSSDVWTVGPPTYPPGLPLTLVPVMAMFGASILVPRLLMHATLVLFLALVFRYFARDGRRTLAWGTVAMLGTFLLLADFANTVGSDLGLCAFTWVTIVLVEGQGRWSPKRAWLIGTAGVLAISYRLAAVPVVPALALWAWLRRREVGRLPWAVGAVWVAAFLVVWKGFGSAGEVVQSVAVGATEGGNDPSLWASVRWVLVRLDSKILSYRFALSDAFLYPFPIRLANQIYHLVALGLTPIGLWALWRPAWRSYGLSVVVMTCGMLLAAPVWDARYALVLSPFLCYGFLRGIAEVLGRFGERSGARSMRYATVVAVVVSVLASVDAARSPNTLVVPTDDEWRQIAAAVTASVSASVSGVEARAASNQPRVFTWLTRIPAAGLANVDLERFLAEVDRLGLTHVVISRATLAEPVADRFDGWRRVRPDMFMPILQVGALEAYRIDLSTR